MDKYFRYFIYFLIASTLAFSVVYISLFINQGQYAKGEFEIINQEPYSIHVEISAQNQTELKRIYRGSIEQGKTKKFTEFIYGQGIYIIKLNKKFNFSIGNFNDKINFSKRLIIKDNKAYFESDTQ